MPPWRNEYLPDTARASWDVFRTLITMDGCGLGATFRRDPRGLELFERSPTVGCANRRALAHPCAKRGMPDFPETPAAPGKRATNSSLMLRSRRVNMDPDADPRMGLAARSHRSNASLRRSASRWRCWRWCGWPSHCANGTGSGLVTGLALAAAVGARVVLLGFLDATSIPSNNMLYLSPVAPIALALVPAVLFGIVAFFKNEESR